MYDKVKSIDLLPNNLLKPFINKIVFNKRKSRKDNAVFNKL